MHPKPIPTWRWVPPPRAARSVPRPTLVSRT